MPQGVLGILPDAPANVLHIRNPVFPTHLQERAITNLAIGRSRVSLRFQRHASGTLVNVLVVESGDDRLQVRIEVG